MGENLFVYSCQMSEYTIRRPNSRRTKRIGSCPLLLMLGTQHAQVKAAQTREGQNTCDEKGLQQRRIHVVKISQKLVYTPFQHSEVEVGFRLLV